MEQDTIFATLRKAFPDEQVGKLPRLNCNACSDAIKNRQGKSCADHKMIKCKICDNWISEKHIHLDYINHGLVTNRLLDADPSWTWEPMALDQQGLPALDKNGGLWIKLTVGGVTRPGYGDAQGKTGPNAVKEAIGDALRNAAMRFGVALDLWAKADLDHGESQPPEPQSAPEPTVDLTNMIDNQLSQVERAYLKSHWTYPFKASAVPKSKQEEIGTLILSCIGTGTQQEADTDAVEQTPS